MPTNLLEQAERTNDARFISQVRSVLMRELPDLLAAVPGGAPGTYTPGADVATRGQNAGKARAFGRQLVAQREQVVTQVAGALAGQPAILLLNLNAAPVEPATTPSTGEILFASENVLINNARIVIRSLAEIE
jgi:hypothetical protein